MTVVVMDIVDCCPRWFMTRYSCLEKDYNGCVRYSKIVKDRCLRGAVQKNSILKDIIQIEVDPPPSHPIFDKFIFDKFIFDTVLVMLTSLPPLEFLTKIVTF